METTDNLEVPDEIAQRVFDLVSERFKETYSKITDRKKSKKSDETKRS